MALTAFQQRLDRVLRANELGPYSEYEIHSAGPAPSGWSYGVCQWDVGQAGTVGDSARARLLDILTNAQDANGHYIIDDGDPLTDRAHDTRVAELYQRAQVLG